MVFLCLENSKFPVFRPQTNTGIRFPNDVIEQAEDAIRGKDCACSAFVIEAVRVALDNLREEEAGGR